ncbi:MAG: hypothetical protein ACE15B_24845 [Bryobacteraceae bacterium]
MRTAGALALVLWFMQSAATTAELQPATVQAFDAYIRAVEARVTPRTGARFLWVDESPERVRQVRAGEVLSEAWAGKAESGVAGGLIHDWIGAVFIPGATLEKTLALVEDYDNHKNIYKPEVIDSKLLSRQGREFKIYLRLVKTKVITVVLNTNHDVLYTPVNAKRMRSRSYSTRIAEVADAGKPGEHELPVGKDHGFLWRLYSYWRFEERDGGVYVECEAISLTRKVPAVLSWLINPIIRNLPRESLANTLRATREVLAR